MPTNTSWQYPEILPISYQSKDITFSEWITLFTLCLAPLIAHIVAGVPRPSYLCQARPKWHDRICHFNPTSILWRYAAIADRRIRAKAWSTADMAAANALFWTTKGWDGSEDTATMSVGYCDRLPEKPRVSVPSASAISTGIVTIQGVQVIAVLASIVTGSHGIGSFVLNIAIDLIFYPIDFIGLLRLSCALWLTDDFIYTVPQDLVLTRSTPVRPPAFGGGPRAGPRATISTQHRFRSVSWGSRAFYALYILPMVWMWSISIVLLAPGAASPRLFTTTTCLMAVFYQTCLTATIVICGYYFARGHTTTIVPCISSVWYKAYTIVLFVLVTAVITVACIETKKTPCGKYTSMPGLAGEATACATSVTHLGRTSSASNIGVGIASIYPPGNRTNEPTSGDRDQYWIYNFTGVCLGSLDSTTISHAKTIDIVKGNASGDSDPGLYL